MNLDSVLGGKFSIISKSGVRYVGSLLGVEGEKKTLSFEKVASYGSEGRIGNGRDIPPSSNIFDFIIFKAEEIAHLKLIEPPPPKAPQQENFTDPAIVQTGPRHVPTEGSSTQPDMRPPYTPEPSRPFEAAPEGAYPQPPQEAPYGSQAYPDSNNGPEQYNDKSNQRDYQRDYQGGHRNSQNKKPPRGNYRNGPRNNRGRPGLTIPEDDFDFQSSNAQFDKEELKKEFSNYEFGSNSSNSQDGKVVYDKKTSFFDSLSCDSMSKAEGQPSEPFNQRKNNFETFGINSNYNRHRNNQGHHRGNRGRNNYHSHQNGRGGSNRGHHSPMNSRGGHGDKALNSHPTEQ